ncbi:MAG: beta-phosphoglucomutase [Clostridiales bacterium]|nr:beta-phosphoglucomutase [Clostridiales bacterium]
MMVKGIIFDLDGVLLCTDEYHYEAWKTLSDKLGIYFDKTINNKLRGVSRMESLDIILGDAKDKFTTEQKMLFAEEKNTRYRSLLSKMTTDDVSDEVRLTLCKIRAAGIKTAIGSSSKNTRYIMEQTSLTEYFDAISDGNNITRSKPDPEVFLKAAQYLNLSPCDCFVIEDAYAGIDAAKAGGFTAVAIGDATTHEKADYRIKTFGELLKTVGLE